jgi:hypothetical protein
MWWAALLNSIVALLESGAGGGGGAYESIATAVGTGSSATITFSSIPSTYKHLQLRVLGRSLEAGAGKSNAILRINNDSTTANYITHYLSGNGSSASAGSITGTAGLRFNDTLSRGGQPANVMATQIIDIQDYTATMNRTVRMFQGMDANDTSGIVHLYSGLYINTTAVNRLDFICPDGNFTTSSVFSLYGIKGA